MDPSVVRELQVLLSVMEQASERVVITDKEGTILYVNSARILGGVL